MYNDLHTSIRKTQNFDELKSLLKSFILYAIIIIKFEGFFARIVCFCFVLFFKFIYEMHQITTHKQYPLRHEIMINIVCFPGFKFFRLLVCLQFSCPYFSVWSCAFVYAFSGSVLVVTQLHYIFC